MKKNVDLAEHLSPPDFHFLHFEVIVLKTVIVNQTRPFETPGSWF